MMCWIRSFQLLQCGRIKCYVCFQLHDCVRTFDDSWKWCTILEVVKLLMEIKLAAY